MLTDAHQNRPTLRRLLIFDAAVRSGSIGGAALDMGLTQPAATHALAKLEEEAGEPLLQRGVTGSAMTAAGRTLHRRVERMLDMIKTSLAAVLPSARRVDAIVRSLTDTQSKCHFAIADQGSFRQAAVALAIADPTLHRAARAFEAAVGVPLYTRRPQGFAANAVGLKLAVDLRLALLEIDQGLDELAMNRGEAGGRLSIGCLPLMPKAMLAMAVADLLRDNPNVAVFLEEAPYATLLRRLQTGDIDVVAGALRRRVPGLRQRRLFPDPYVVVVRDGHPLVQSARPARIDFAAYPWVVPAQDTPRREALEAFFARLPTRPPIVMETSSLDMMGAMLANSDCLTILCRSQIDASPLTKNVVVMPVDIGEANRTVGMTSRAAWLPTSVQKRFVSLMLKQAQGT